MRIRSLEQIVDSSFQSRRGDDTRLSHAYALRDELGTVSAFSGKVRKKPAILAIMDDLALAQEISTNAEKHAYPLYIYWSLENLSLGYRPNCDVLITTEDIVRKLENPMFSRLAKLLADVPAIVISESEKQAISTTEDDPHSSGFLSVLDKVYRVLPSNAKGQDIVHLAIESYHYYYDFPLPTQTKQPV